MNGSHIAIPTILKVGKGTLKDIGSYIKDSRIENAVVYFGTGLVDMVGDTVLQSFQKGRRTSVPAKLAYGIIADTDVIKSAPEKFLYSGIGDLVSKITALYDWVFEDEHGYAVLNDIAMMIAKK